MSDPLNTPLKLLAVRVAELEETLRPFARYAEHMRGRWGQRDDSAYYGVKRVDAPMIRYGDFRRAAEVMRRKR